LIDISRGYRQSRVDLTPLAGQNVHFRFRACTDLGVGAPGWLVDDLTVFSCAESAPTAGSPDMTWNGNVPARAVDPDEAAW